MRVDMHMHTTASDGTWPPEILVRKVVQAGIRIFSVTDHDSTENVSRTAGLAKDRGLHFIPGVEIDASYDNKNIHILGYSINPESEGLRKVLSANRKCMEERDEESILFLAKKGHPVSLDEYGAYGYSPQRGGWKTLNYFIDKGLCRNSKDFFGLFEGAGNPFDSIDFVTPDAAISSIEQAGGISILAHPGAKFYDGGFKGIINGMMERGIDGIECFHPENNAEITLYCLELCKKNGLSITGGSDCHGDFVKERILGKPEIELEQLALANLVK